MLKVIHRHGSDVTTNCKYYDYEFTISPSASAAAVTEHHLVEKTGQSPRQGARPM